MVPSKLGLRGHGRRPVSRAKLSPAGKAFQLSNPGPVTQSHLLYTEITPLDPVCQVATTTIQTGLHPRCGDTGEITAVRGWPPWCCPRGPRCWGPCPHALCSPFTRRCSQSTRRHGGLGAGGGALSDWKHSEPGQNLPLPQNKKSQSHTPHRRGHADLNKEK